MGKKSRAKRERRERREEQEIEPRHSRFGIEVSAGQKTGLESVCLFVIRWATYLMLLTPLIVSARFFFPFVGPKGLYLMALIELAFFTWLILAIHSPKYRPRRNALLLALGAFLIILTLATIFGEDPSRSFWSKFERMSGLLMWLHLFAFFLVASNVFKRKKDWLKFFLVSVSAAIVVCFLFFMDKAGLKELPIAAGGSTLGNTSFLATYLLFNLFFAIYLFFALLKEKVRFSFSREIKRIFLVFLLLALILMTLTLMMSKGTAATLSFFGGLGLFFLLWWAFEVKKKRARRLGKIALTFSIIIFLLGIVLFLWPDSFVQNKYIEMRSRARPLLWQMAWIGFLEKPILGWGPQNFTFVFNKNFEPCFYVSECGGQIRFDQAHNIIFDNLVDAGILGLLGYLSILGSVFFILWRKYFARKTAFWTAAFPTALLVAHFTQNLTVFDMPASFLMLFLVLGFVAFLSQEDRESPEKRIRILGSGLSVTLVLICICLSLFYFVLKPAIAGRNVIKAMVTQSYKEGMAAQRKVFSSPMGRYQTRAHFADILLKMTQKGAGAEGHFHLIINELEKSIKSSPLDYFNHLNLGKVYDAYGGIFDETKLQRAEEVLKRALELSPTKQAAYWEAAKNKAMLGKNKEALALAEKAVDLEPRYEFSHLFLLNLARVLGERELLERKVKEAKEALPESAPKFDQFLK